MDELNQIGKLNLAPVVQTGDELIELLKKTDRITVQQPTRRMLYWADAWCKWVVRSKSVELYQGDSLLEALKVLTKED